jgi:hypothetical protein
MPSGIQRQRAQQSADFRLPRGRVDGDQGVAQHVLRRSAAEDHFGQGTNAQLHVTVGSTIGRVADVLDGYDLSDSNEQPGLQKERIVTAGQRNEKALS